MINTMYHHYMPKRCIGHSCRIRDHSMFSSLSPLLPFILWRCPNESIGLGLEFWIWKTDDVVEWVSGEQTVWRSYSAGKSLLVRLTSFVWLHWIRQVAPGWRSWLVRSAEQRYRLPSAIVSGNPLNRFSNTGNLVPNCISEFPVPDSVQYTAAFCFSSRPGRVQC